MLLFAVSEHIQQNAHKWRGCLDVWTMKSSLTVFFFSFSQNHKPQRFFILFVWAPFIINIFFSLYGLSSVPLFAWMMVFKKSPRFGFSFRREFLILISCVHAYFFDGARRFVWYWLFIVFCLSFILFRSLTSFTSINAKIFSGHV